MNERKWYIIASDEDAVAIGIFLKVWGKALFTEAGFDLAELAISEAGPWAGSELFVGGVGEDLEELGVGDYEERDEEKSSH